MDAAADGGAAIAGPMPPFSAEEWAALFPMPPRGGTDPSDVPNELRELAARVAEERDAAPPLTRDAFYAGLEGAPAVRLLARLRAFLARTVLPHYGLLRLLQQAFTLFFVALVWIENDGRFGTRQLIVATVAYVLRFAIWDSRVFVGWFAPSEKDVFMRPDDATSSGSSADGYFLAGVVRYRQIAQATGTWLTQHVPRDSLCTCPRPSCTGGVIRAVFFSYSASAVSRVVGYLSIYVVLYVWTPIITFGASTWSTPWAATLSVVGIVVISVMVAIVILGGDAHGPWKPRDAKTEPYMALHAALIMTWRQTKAGADARRAVAWAGLLGDSVGLLIVTIGSSCIPANLLAGVLFLLLFLLVFEISVLAAANTSPDRIAALYRSASHSLRSIGASASARGRTDLATSALWHERILTGFADVDPYRVRAFGVPVTYDLTRTIVATLFTLGVGLWSVLRGAGVGVTIEMVCPRWQRPSELHCHGMCLDARSFCIRRTCAHCERPGAERACTACGSVLYCNRSCQREHWKAHAPLCAALKWPVDFAFVLSQRISATRPGGFSCPISELLDDADSAFGCFVMLRVQVGGVKTDWSVEVLLDKGKAHWHVKGKCHHHIFGSATKETDDVAAAQDSGSEGSTSSDSEESTAASEASNNGSELDKSDEGSDEGSADTAARELAEKERERALKVLSILGLSAPLASSTPFVATSPLPFFPGPKNQARCRPPANSGKEEGLSKREALLAPIPTDLPARPTSYAMPPTAEMFNCPGGAPLFAKKGDAVASAWFAAAEVGNVLRMAEEERAALVEVNLRTGISRVLVREGWKVLRLAEGVVEALREAIAA
ncbi:hypothetical protein DFJ74DRAFT_740333 [Hyaloraphidium curvatum]|nr:hypothetical protein DFJ74DRAFT_740333 [Hyaloraphidium curvatum]